ncbi:MAG TPA: hypothetical protein VGS07_31650 [Thermoanaerobaculia bacterium]|jgi:hypothetical protein|nr:hypothetical protein [Thermoanaerobaculia bacterium]
MTGIIGGFPLAGPRLAGVRPECGFTVLRIRETCPGLRISGKPRPVIRPGKLLTRPRFSVNKPTNLLNGPEFEIAGPTGPPT